MFYLFYSTCGHCYSWEDFGPHQERSGQSQSSAHGRSGWSELNCLFIVLLLFSIYQWLYGAFCTDRLISTCPSPSPMLLCSTGWQTPVSGLCVHDGGDAGLPGQTEADPALLCYLSSQRAEVYGTYFSGLIRDLVFIISYCSAQISLHNLRHNLIVTAPVSPCFVERTLAETLWDQPDGGAYTEGCDSVLCLCNWKAKGPLP